MTNADCNNDNACTTESCVANQCQITTLNCNDGVSCTVDSCNPALGCTHAPNNGLCNDGMYCNGQETCNQLTGCQSATPINCNQNNIPGIAKCTNNPDNNPFT